MLSHFLKTQLQGLAEMIGGVFGLTDDTGHVLYASRPEALSQENLFKGYAAGAGALFSNSYFFLGAFAFYALTLRDENTFYLFLQMPEDKRGEEDRTEAIRLLSVAAYAISGQELNNEKRLSELFRRLIADGGRNVAPEEIEEVCGSRIAGASRLRLLMVTPADDMMRGEREAVLSVVQGLFPAEQDFLTVALENGRILTVCPEDTSEIADEVRAGALALQDTVMTETLTNVYVSGSGVFGGMRELDAAYRQAERARSIGETFDLPQKYCEYDSLGLEKLIFSFPTQACLEYVTETFGTEFLRDKSAPELLQTVQTFLDCNQNGSEAARILYIHRNTMMYRLDKFSRMTGLDCSKFNTGLRIRLAMLLLQYLKRKAPELLR